MAIPIFQRQVTDAQGNIVVGATVEVKHESTGLNAELFSNRAGTTAQQNPFQTGGDGLARFYAAPGEYRITATKDLETITWRYQVLTGSAALVEAGTATSLDVTENPTDTTAGRLLKVGDFGVGVSVANPIAVSDIDAINIPSGGNYQFASDGLGVYPGTGVVVGALSVSHYRIGTGSVIVQQIAHCAKNAGGGGLYKREYQDAAWSPWQEIYHTGNILGTVSQSAGAPTGAIIQRGSNANGEFVRFADGTQITTTVTRQIGSITTAVNGVFASPSQGPFTQPVGFTGSSTSFTSSNTEQVWFATLAGNTLFIRAFTAIARGVLTNYTITTIGRWY